MAKSPSKARLFIALELPDDAREQLVRWQQDALSEREELRLVAREALHVTLVFLGYLPEGEIRAIGRLMKAALPDVEVPRLSALGVKPVPPRRPRLLALDLDDQGGRAEVIQLSLSAALETAGLYTPEVRPFWPHVTLARVRKGASVRGEETLPPPAEPWQAEAVVLFRSRLSSRGARYEPLERIGLA